MPIPPAPFIACRVRDELPDEVAELSATLQAGSKASQSALAGRLITDASCDLIDAFFNDMVLHMLETTGDDGFREAHEMLEDVKAKLRHALGWLTGFFSNERLAPVVRHYQGLLVHLPTAHGDLAHLAFAITPELARDSQAALANLRDDERADIKAGVEVLIRVVEAALVPLMYVPKERMRFNFIVDKTLNGFIAIANALLFRSLRKLAAGMPRELYPLVADHLGQFLHQDAPLPVGE